MEIEKIIPPSLPFEDDEKIFQCCDEDGSAIGDPYSYNDWIQMIENISGVSQDLLGNKEKIED